MSKMHKMYLLFISSVHLCGWNGSVVGRKLLALGFKFQLGYIWNVFHFYFTSLCLYVTFLHPLFNAAHSLYPERYNLNTFYIMNDIILTLDTQQFFIWYIFISSWMLHNITITLYYFLYIQAMYEY